MVSKYDIVDITTDSQHNQGSSVQHPEPGPMCTTTSNTVQYHGRASYWKALNLNEWCTSRNVREYGQD